YTCVARFDGQELTLESASEGFARVTGFAVEEFNVRVAALSIHPDDLLGVLQGFEGLMRGETASGEARLVTKSGDLRWLRYVAEPSFEPGRPSVLRIRGAVQDVTEGNAPGEPERE